jgi:sarcosine oxidase subunit beta
LLAADDVLAGTFHAGDGLADPNSVVMGYINAAKRLGVRAVTGVEVTDIVTAQGRITGVITNRGEIACEGIVNAAGPWSARVSEMAGIPLPVTPLRRQMLTTTALPEIPADFPFIIDFAQSLYFHREGEGLLTGQSNPHERPGYDESVDLQWELAHMEAAIQRLPILAHAGRAAHWAGLYEVTPDAHPIIDAISSLPGYYVITGFSGHGFMHGPGAGLLLSEIILDGKAHTLDICELGYSRFADAQRLHEYNVI